MNLYNMDLQSRKTAFVQDFLKLQSEELISCFEELLNSEKETFDTMSIEQLNCRIDKSLQDSKKDNVIATSDLLKEIDNWE